MRASCCRTMQWHSESPFAVSHPSSQSWRRRTTTCPCFSAPAWGAYRAQRRPVCALLFFPLAVALQPALTLPEPAGESDTLDVSPSWSNSRDKPLLPPRASICVCVHCSLRGWVLKCLAQASHLLSSAGHPFWLKADAPAAAFALVEPLRLELDALRGAADAAQSEADAALVAARRAGAECTARRAQVAWAGVRISQLEAALKAGNSPIPKPAKPPPPAPTSAAPAPEQPHAREVALEEELKAVKAELALRRGRDDAGPSQTEVTLRTRAERAEGVNQKLTDALSRLDAAARSQMEQNGVEVPDEGTAGALSALRAQLEASEARCAAMQAQASRQQSKLESSDHRRADRSLTAKLSSLQAALDEQQRDAAALRLALAASQRKQAVLQEALTCESDDAAVPSPPPAGVAAELVRLQQRCRALQDKCDAYEARIRELESDAFSSASQSERPSSRGSQGSSGSGWSVRSGGGGASAPPSVSGSERGVPAAADTPPASPLSRAS